MAEESVSRRHLGDEEMAGIREGMPVVDRNGKEIGKVKSLYLGTVTDEEAEHGTGPATVLEPVDDAGLIGEFVEVFSPNREVPEVVRNRLRRYGFIRIDTGLLADDYYVLREQIASVADDQVRLKVEKEDLIH